MGIGASMFGSTYSRVEAIILVWVIRCSCSNDRLCPISPTSTPFAGDASRDIHVSPPKTQLLASAIKQTRLEGSAAETAPDLRFTSSWWAEQRGARCGDIVMTELHLIGHGNPSPRTRRKGSDPPTPPDIDDGMIRGNRAVA
jgi:hypothetical protein